MEYFLSPIRENVQIAADCYKLVFENRVIAQTAIAGQFLHVRITNQLEPLLRRPFSIHFVNKKNNLVEIIYRVRGIGTRSLLKKQADETLDILGPLGNGFSLEHIQMYQSVYIVGGGIGVAPLRLLTAQVCAKQYNGQAVTVLLGAKSADQLVCRDEFLSLPAGLMIATDDGSAGRQGTAVEILKGELQGNKAVVFACGPDAMLRELAQVVAGHQDVCAYGSFESFMGCGIGMCWGCVVRTRSGYKRACKDGPVFDLNEIAWD